MSSNLPKAVQDQINKANEAQKNLSVNTDTADHQQAHKENNEQQQQQENKQPQAADNRSNDDNYWKNRYDVLQGKYNKEVPALSAKLRDMQTRISELEKAPQKEVSYLSDDEREEYGDVATMMERVAKQAAEDATKSIKETTTQTSQSLYYKDLDSAASGWREKNVDDGFNDWLDEIDPMSGYLRRDLLMDAFSSHDAIRTAQIFNAYGDLNKGKAKADLLQPEPMPNSLVNEQQHNPERRTFTRAEIKQFYQDKTNGKYNGREEEAAAIEREIFASQNGS